jgi:electron transport complex protein RnfD
MKMMQGMLIALTPATIAALWFYRLDALLLITVSLIAAVGAEALWQLALKTPLRIKDLSSTVTGLLFGLTLGPSLPLYIAAIGAALAVVAGKLLWGGFGKNAFNPVLFGRLLIVLLFPGAMAPWLTPVDMVTTATPLAVFRAEGTAAPLFDLFIGNVAGCIGETSAIALLLGFGWLAYKGYADWRIPAAALGTVIAISLIAGHDPFFHLLSGSLLLGALFMATDPVTSPRHPIGRLIFGMGIGAIIMAMRFWSAFPEGTTFAILGMNMMVPIINTYTKPQSKSGSSLN